MPPSSPPAHGKEVNQVSRARPMRRVRVQVGCGYRTGSRFLYVSENWRCFRISKQGHQINEEIRDKEVRLVSDTGEQLGIMSAREALERAMDANLDLVKISPTANPPSASSWTTASTSSSRPSGRRRHGKTSTSWEIKEVRMSPSIDVNDFNVKLRNAQKFLAEGNRVKVTVRFRGREMAHTDIGKGLLLKFAEQCGEVATLDKDPKLDGRHMSIFLSPRLPRKPRSPEPRTF